MTDHESKQSFDSLGLLDHKLKIVKGDLLKSNADFIAHQCNCMTNKSFGLSASMFKTFPYADIYTNREKYSQLGTISVHGDGKDQRYVINMLAQFYPGKCKWKDTYDKRLDAFQKCLEEISRLPNMEGKSIAFPYNIGCGLAGGNWEDYQKILQYWAQTVKMTVYLYCYES